MKRIAVVLAGVAVLIGISFCLSGASRPESILDSVKAVDLVLPDDELAKLSA